jgi:hypothetical protein
MPGSKKWELEVTIVTTSRAVWPQSWDNRHLLRLLEHMGPAESSTADQLSTTEGFLKWRYPKMDGL